MVARFDTRTSRILILFSFASPGVYEFFLGLIRH